MARPQKSFGVLLVVLAFLVWLTAAAGRVRVSPRTEPNPTLYQCRSGVNGAGPCVFGNTTPGWVPGHAGSSDSRYRQGDFVPMRAVLTGLQTGGTYTLPIKYYAWRNSSTFGGLHYYDYLGSYNASLHPNGSLTNVVPCGGLGDIVPSCASAPSEIAIPEDTQTTFPSTAGPGGIPSGQGRQAEGHFSAWGATLVSNGGYPRYLPSVCHPSLNPCGPISNTTSSGSGGAYIQRIIDVKFEAHGPTVVLAWGAHIASARDWGFNKTGAQVGSDQFTLSTGDLAGPGVTGSTGEKTLTLAPDATGRPTWSTQVTPGPPANTVLPVVVGQTVTDTARFTAQNNLPVSGKVNFYVCGPNAQNGCPLGSGTRLEPHPVDVVPTSPPSNRYEAAIEFTPTAPGRYCFRAEFLQDPQGYYSYAAETNNILAPLAGGECFTVVAARLTVTKLCENPNDPGHFNLLATENGTTRVVRANATCSQSGTIDIATLPSGGATFTVHETAGESTDLADYKTPAVRGNCSDNGNGTGSVTLTPTPPANIRTCEIFNALLGEPAPGELELTKSCIPPADLGRFDFLVNGRSVAALSCGETTESPIELAPGVAHQLTVVGVPPTSESDYTTAISGPCAPSGSITLGPGAAVSCTFTNTHRAPPSTGTLTVNKACVPADDGGHFNLTINGTVAGTGANVGCGGTTGAVQVNPGSFKVGETAGNGTQLSRYDVVISGDCAANGTVTVAAGEHAVCLITNARIPTEPPLEKVCYNLNVKPKTVRAGRRARVVARVHIDGRGVQGVRVYLRGPGISAVGTTGRTGRVTFRLTPRRRGLLHVSIRKAYLCPSHPARRIGILGVKTPPITG